MMTPQKRRAAGGGAGSPTRYSILSDPRLSQLFALSSQLEALAQSIDVQPPNSKPELPPKPIPQTFVNNNNGIQSPSNSASPPPPIPPKFQNGGERSLEEKTSVKYTRLEEDQVENNAVVLGEFLVANCHKCYRAFVDIFGDISCDNNTLAFFFARKFFSHDFWKMCSLNLRLADNKRSAVLLSS